MRVTDWLEKLYLWEKYAETLYPLRDEVSDIFEIHYIWDEKCNCTEKFYEADEDTVFLLKFSEKLNDICAFVKSHLRVLEHRVSIGEEIRANLEQKFEVWKRGLCPVQMSRVNRYVKPPDYDEWKTYDEIAENLTSKVIDYDITQKAINEWELSREKLKLSA